MQWLLAHDADTGRAAAYGLSPPLLAASSGQLRAAEALLSAGADANAQDRFGRTALQEACAPRLCADERRTQARWPLPDSTR